MDFKALQAELWRMGDATRGLAVLGAALRLRQGDVAVHPDIEARIRDTDVHRLIALSADRPALAKALGGRMLDVGTGVAALALEAAAQRPALSVVGIDIWDPALALARPNVAASPDADRIEIRTQDVTTLDEVATYTLAWLPAPFLTRAVTQAALDRLVVALAPGGYLAVGLYLPPADSVGAALAALRLTRSGGHLWQCPDVEGELSARGLTAVETCPGPPGVTFVLGRRAYASR